MITLTQSNTFIIGDVAKLLGYIMNALFLALDAIGIANIGLAIILLTIVVKVLMLPLTIKQQKYSKLTSAMNPEITAITKKYKGKKDADTAAKMSAEQKAVYEKYGTSPTGGCLQIFIQIPIMFGLYRVIQNIPAYVPSLKSFYTGILNGADNTAGIMATSGFADTMKANFDNFSKSKADLGNVNSVIDLLTNFTADNWNKLMELYPSAAELISNNVDRINHVNNFLGANMSQTPKEILGVAILIPILAGASQWLSVKLTQTNAPAMDEDNPAAASMKMMTTVMPLMSAFMAFTLPSGLGLYWIAQAVVQIITQLAVNRHIDRIGIDEIIKENVEKQAKKRAKKGLPPQAIANNANKYTKNVDTKTESKQDKIQSLMKKKEEQDKKVKDILESKGSNSAKPGSLAEKAGMVAKMNDKNTKK